MKSLIISMASALGALVAATATAGCILVWIDEPEAPKSLIEK